MSPYGSGIFFQWLEGKREVVKRLMEVIAADPRHAEVIILGEAEEMRKRVFSGWDIEWVSPDDVRAVLFDAISASKDFDSIGSMRRLLKEPDAQTIAIDG